MKEMDNSQEYVKTFYKPEHERIHLFPHFVGDNKFKCESHIKACDFPDGSFRCNNCILSLETSRDEILSLSSKHSHEEPTKFIKNTHIEGCDSVESAITAAISYPDVANPNFKFKIVSNGNSSHHNLRMERGLTPYDVDLTTLSLDGNESVCPGFGVCKILEKKSMKIRITKKYFEELLGYKKCFLLISTAVFVIGVVVGLVGGFGLLSGVRKRSDGTVEDSQKENLMNIITRIVPEKDEQGWVFLRSGSTNGSKYMIINKLLTFYGAQDRCRRLGGHLAHVNTIKEQIFLEEFLNKEMQNGEQLLGSIGFWLGARRPRGGHAGSCMFDQWKWVDSYGRSHGTINGFTAFMPGKPDKYNPEECLYMAHNKGFQEDRLLKWDDAPCDPHSFGGIKSLCEVEIP